MCGFLGFFSPEGCLPTEELFQQSLKKIKHRGPDGQGFYKNSRLCLGHVRLSVIDLEHGQQPWVDQETGCVLVYNGEIYNHKELRQKLEKQGHKFRGHCDTEVLMRALIQYGSAALDQLIGMYAFVFYDPKKSQLFCARDEFGIKPFYYSNEGSNFLFASEIKALLPMMAKRPKAKAQALSDYIHLQYLLDEKTFFEGVFRLLPGESFWINAKGSVQDKKLREFSPTEDFEGDSAKASERVYHLLQASVRRQLVSDVPLGAHLSGGLDTGTLCSLAAKELFPNQLLSFTASFNEGGIFDDSKWTELSAQRLNSRHFQCSATAQDFANIYEHLVWQLDEPMAGQGVFAQYIVSKLAKEQVTVVLGGQGADELFGGYTRYYILLYLEAQKKEAGLSNINLGIGLNELKKASAQLASYAPLLKQVQEHAFTESAEDTYWRMIDRSESFKGDLCPDFLSQQKAYSVRDAVFEKLKIHPEAELLNRILHFESRHWLSALLHVEDRMSMAVSLESRVPILDPELAHFAFSLPTRLKLQGGVSKAIMRESFKNELDPRICKRLDKVGFPVPTARWFAEPLKEWLCDILLSEKSLSRGIFTPEALRRVTQKHSDTDRSVWGMLNLELWHRRFIDA